jgi:hypothetical protein
MRYFIDSCDGGGTWHVIDGSGFLIASAAYMNKYVAQTECDRLNGECE